MLLEAIFGGHLTLTKPSLRSRLKVEGLIVADGMAT